MNLSLSALLLGGALLGCGTDVASPDPGVADDAALNAIEDGASFSEESKDDSIASTSTYYQVRRDYRRCVSPLCGGYWVKRTNLSSTRCFDGSYASECYVAEMDLSRLALDPTTLDKFQSDVNAGTAVLRGTIGAGPTFNSTRLGKFNATEGWKSLSSNAPTGTFYRVTDLGIRCITHPCFSFHAAKLNSSAHANLSGLVPTVNTPSPTMSDDGVLLAGVIRTGPRGPAGYGRIISYNAAFERVRGTPAPTCDLVRCGAGTHCELQEVVCITAPCYPQPVCVPDDTGPTCANVRCAAGTHCEMVQVMCVRAPCPPLPQCVPDQAPCRKTGCSGQVCADEDRITTCEFRPEYACYRDATCERQADGRCGFTVTPALTQCLGG